MNDSTNTEENAVEEKAVELTPVQKCEAMHAKGMDEDSIIGALAQHDGMSIIKAVGVFKKFQKSAGLILSKEDRQSKIEELISAQVTSRILNAKGEEITKESKTSTTETSIDIKQATADLEKELQLSGGACKGHIRRYCKANDIEMPSRQQLATEALEEYKDAVVAGAKAGKSKAELAKQLVADFESMEDEKSARRAVARIAKSNDIELSRGGSDHSKVIDFLISNGGDFATKDGLANAMVAELEITLSAGKRIWGQYQFAKQFAAQVATNAAQVDDDSSVE